MAGYMLIGLQGFTKPYWDCAAGCLAAALEPCGTAGRYFDNPICSCNQYHKASCVGMSKREYFANFLHDMGKKVK